MKAHDLAKCIEFLPDNCLVDIRARRMPIDDDKTDKFTEMLFEAVHRKEGSVNQEQTTVSGRFIDFNAIIHNN